MPELRDQIATLARSSSRREVDRHRQQILGITASEARYITRDNGKLEFVIDVRVGAREKQGLVKDVLIAQWVVGLITDFNVPVILERSEAGQLTVVARAVVRLPDVRVTAYSYGSLGMAFASNLRQLENGSWVDGFGFPAPDPTGEVVVQENWHWEQSIQDIDDVDLGDFRETTAQWVLQ
jgi:hypothetical protein